MVIDWRALLVGVGITFSPFAIAVTLSAWVGDLRLVEGGVRYPVWYFPLIVALGLFLGAFIAGYLHSSKLADGALYGLAVGLLGIVVPAIAALVLVSGLLAVVVAVRVAQVVATLWIWHVFPIVVGGTVVVGVIGGVLGSLLRRRYPV